MADQDGEPTQSSAAERQIDEGIFSDPSLELRSVDVRQGIALFAPMTEATYMGSVFLNMKAAHQRLEGADKTYYVPLLDLLALFQESAPAAKPIHFVFHNAFCCSTLLSRCLEHLSFAFALREPNALKDCVAFKRNGWPRVGRDLLLDCVLSLLSRTFADGKTAFVKTNDHCNAILDDVLERRPDAGALLLYGDLDTFVCKALKNEERTQQVVRAAQDVVDPAHVPEALRGIEHQALPPPLAAAYCWAAHGARFREVLERFPEARLASLDYREILRDPAGVLRGYLELCGIAPSEPEIARATSKEAIGRHAKRPRVEYTAASHEQELAELRARLSSELADAHRWIEANRLTDSYANLPRPLVLRGAAA